ncbi:hypothetical protein ACWC0C_14755 [Streptomyces sp. NPDC001709]
MSVLEAVDRLPVMRLRPDSPLASLSAVGGRRSAPRACSAYR